MTSRTPPLTREAPSGGPGPVRRLRRIPPWAWLVALVALSALVRYAFGRRIVAPWIFQDELIYGELARSLAETGELRIRGERFNDLFGVLYPLVLVPAYLLHDSIVSAYATAKTINGIAFSLAAVPTYFLARRVVDPPLALVAAGLSVAVPGALYSGMLMTENVFYPLVVTVALALVLALERPTPLRVVALLAAVAVAFLARAQAVVFAPVILTAPLVLVAFERSGLRGLARYRWLYAIPAGAVGALVALETLRGRSPLELLGAYRVVVERGAYDTELVARWALYHVAQLDLAVGVLPFAALLLLVGLAPRLGRREQAFVAVALTLSVFMVLQVAAFASRFAHRVEERNMFHLMPLLLVALVLWLGRGMPRPRVLALAAAATAALLPLTIPFEQLLNVSATSDTFGLLFWWDVVVWGVPAHRIWIPALALSAVLALLFLLVPRRLGLVLPALVLAVFVASSYSVEHWVRTASIGALFHGITVPQRDWVDRAVGPDAQVAVIWTAEKHWLWVVENEFFSRSVRDVYYLHEPLPFGLAQTPLTINYRSGLLEGPDQSEMHADYVLVSDHVPLAGTVLESDDTKGLRIVRPDGPLRFAHAIDGVHGDAWAGPNFGYRRYQCSGGHVRVALQQDPALIERPQNVIARDRRGRIVARQVVRSGEALTWMRVPLEPDPSGNCNVRFRVSPTAIPAHVQPGSTDMRRLGIRVLGADYRP